MPDNESAPPDATPARLPNALVRQLKARAQHLEPVIKVGHAGLTPELIRSLDAALAQHELVKVKFTGLKEQKHELSPELAARTASHLVWTIGHCAILFRARPRPAAEPAN